MRGAPNAVFSHLIIFDELLAENIWRIVLNGSDLYTEAAHFSSMCVRVPVLSLEGRHCPILRVVILSAV